jgi:hypothetical protein
MNAPLQGCLFGAPTELQGFAQRSFRSPRQDMREHDRRKCHAPDGIEQAAQSGPEVARGRLS